MQCVNKRNGKVAYPLKYFSVHEEEFFDTLNYVISLDKKSQTFPTIMTYVRRRMAGVSLVTKELVERWHLSKSKVHSYCILILVYSRLVMSQTETVLDNIDIGSVFAKFIALFKQTLYTLAAPIAMIVDWVLAGNLTDQLVLMPPQEVLQRIKVMPKPGDWKEFEIDLYCDEQTVDEIPLCAVCNALHGKMDQQRMKCTVGETLEHTFTLTQEQIDRLGVKRITNDEDVVGLKAVKERAYKNMPKCAFSTTATMHYIKAGPGCGKSYLIRKLATEHDLVLAPFTKLMTDYKHVKDDVNESSLTS